MSAYLIQYLIITLAVTTGLMAWFKTELPVLVYNVLKLMGYKKYCKSFWELIPAFETTVESWQDAISVYEKPFISALLTCRYCLSFHLSFWISLMVFLFCILAYIPTSAIIIPVAVMTCPFISNSLYRLA